MANERYGHILKIDTAGAGLVASGPFKVKRVRWVARTAASGNRCVVTDGNNNTIWEDSANGSNYHKADLLETWWNEGIVVPTLDNGILYIEK